MNRRLFYFIPLCILGAGSAAVSAKTEAPKPSKSPLVLEAAVDRSTITIGDPFVYTVRVRREPSVTLVNPLTVAVSEPFEVKKSEDFKRAEDGRAVEGKRLTLTSFRLGDFVLEPVQVSYKTADGKAGTEFSPRIYISVASVQKGPPAKDIRPAKGVIAILFRYARQLTVSLLVILTLLLAGLLILRRLKKKQTEQIKPRDLLSPEEEALRNLHALFDSSILRQGKFREYFFSLSEIMRIYFEKRFLIFAAESTTAELTGLLKQKGIARELIEQIRELLEAADLAKFAKWKPEPAEVLRLNQQAEDIVRKASAKT